MDELKEDYVLYRCGQGGSVDRRERKEEYTTFARLSPHGMEIKMCWLFFFGIVYSKIEYVTMGFSSIVVATTLAKTTQMYFVVKLYIK